MTRTKREQRSTWTVCSRSASATSKQRLSATAVIAAAGSGERLGAGGPKAFAELGGRPLLAWSLAAFVAAESVGAAVIAAPPGFEGEAEGVAGVAAAGLPVTVVTGGEQRSQSVAAAMAAVSTELVAVHDAARPLVTAVLIDEVLGLLASSPDAQGAIAATPLTDTIKRAEGGGDAPPIAETVSRDGLWAAQTPQAFRAEPLREILGGDPERVAAATDEAMLVEQAGGAVLICTAPPDNLKVTTEHDLRVAEVLAAAAGSER